MSRATVTAILAKIEALYAGIYPKEQFEAHFFDDTISRLYERERETAQMMNLAMGIAIFISCIGLFGLAAFTANQRTKEIGIRKVLGASVPRIVSLLTREFILLVLLSTVIAAPLADWCTHQWLQGFAYRATMPWWIYGLAGFLAIIIALLTVSFQTVRAARANPVDSLKTE